MTLACGYGRPVPSNRFLANRQENGGGLIDVAPAILGCIKKSKLELVILLYVFLVMCGGLCDSSGLCGACK